ncbi:MAG: magnesium chelatase family protein [Rickettsiales bacterium]|jgi:magnesium chelatase family protein
MVTTVKTFAFNGIEVSPVNVQVNISSSGNSSFTIVGLADKAVGESKERVRTAIASIGLALPYTRITVNLAPADIVKEGSHFDLAIALGLLIELGALRQEDVNNYYALGELSLDGSITGVNGILSAAIGAGQRDSGIICPEVCGPEAVWAGDISILAPKNLIVLLNHFKGLQLLSQPKPNKTKQIFSYPDLIDVKGQETAKRALEIAAAGGHNFLMIGPPGTGKSMIASRLPGLIPDLDLKEMLEINMIHSISGKITDGKLIWKRPFRDPHHSCSMPAMVGGGSKAKPGEISLAHNGILFLDELAEFPRQVLDSLRQPIENGNVTISRVQSHINYPADFQLIAAMNPCKCGYLSDQAKACKKAPICGRDYQAKISGPLMDRMDIIIEVPQIDIFDEDVGSRESSEVVSKRVLAARNIQKERYEKEESMASTTLKINSRANGKVLEKYTEIDEASQKILKLTMEKMGISIRGYNRILRVSRTIADLDGSENIEKSHLLEAISYRRGFIAM